MKKTVKQYSHTKDLSEADFKELKILAVRYTAAKNYFFSRFSGIVSYERLFNHRQSIRDVFVEELTSYNKHYNFKLPARFWKLALDEAIANIKSNWSNTINDCKKIVTNNEHLSDHDKHYVRYILSAHSLMFNILTCKPIIIPEKINYSDIDFKRLNKYIRRLIRKHKREIPYSYKKNSFSLDTSMYKYGNERELFIQSLTKGKRILLSVNTDNKFNKTLFIRINNDKIDIYCAVDIEQKKKYANLENIIIGLDKNYENVIATSTGNIYGEGINKISNEYTDTIKKISDKRDKLWNIVKKLKENDPLNPKIDRIINHNLGNKKNNKQKNSIKERIKSEINHSLDEFIKKEHPDTVVVEDLTFTSKSKYNKKSKNKLSSWMKGYIQERIDYKSAINGIEIKKINAAGTSQTCSECGFYLGKRSVTDMFHCPHCGKDLSVHINSSKVILQRAEDTEIKLKMPPTAVFKILEGRNSRLLELKTGTTTTQDTFYEMFESPSESEIFTYL